MSGTADPWSQFSDAPQPAQAAPAQAAPAQADPFAQFPDYQGQGHPTAGPSGDFWTDALRRVGTAAASAVGGVAGAVLHPLSPEYVQQTFGNLRLPGPGLPDGTPPVAPTAENIKNRLMDMAGATEYVPQTELGRIGQGALTGGMTAIANPATLPAALGSGGAAQAAADLFPNHPAVAATLGALLGGGVAQKAAQVVASPLTAASSLSPEMAQTVRAAQGFGVNIPAPLLSGNKFSKLAFDQSSNLPFSGAGAAQEANQSAFNRGLAAQMGETADRITPDVMQAARTRIGGTFNRVAQNTAIPMTNDLMTNLQGVVDNARLNLSADSVQPVERQAMNIVNTAANNSGNIGGRAYIDLTAKGGPIDTLLNASDSGLRQAGSQFRGVLDDALQANAAPQDLADLSQARSQWKAMRTIEPLAAKSVEGNIPPALVMNPVRQSYGQMAFDGGGPMGDLARIGQVLKSPPDSGTATRALVDHLVTGGAGALAAGGAGEAVGGHLGALATALAGMGVNRVANAAMRSPLLTSRLVNGALNGGPLLPSPTAALLAQQLLKALPASQAATATSASSQP